MESIERFIARWRWW